MNLYYYKAHINRVIDGDTVEAVIDVGFKISIRDNLRLSRINAPETSTDTGRRSKEFVTTLLTNKDVIINTIKREKYGRLLAEIYMDGLNINDEIVKLGYAEYANR